MQTKFGFEFRRGAFSLGLMLGLFAFATAFSQPLNIPEDQEIPNIGTQDADILGGIPNTNIDRIYKDRLDRGILMPEFGIEDVFMTKGSKETLDLEKFGFICIEPTVGNIVISRDPPADPKVPRKARTIEAQSEGTTMLIVTERAPGQTICKADQRGRLLKVFRVTVTTKDIMQTLMELKALMGKIEGVEIRVVGTKVVLDGEIIVPGEIERFVRVKSKFPDVVDLVQVSPLSFQYLAQKMEEQIAGGPDRPRDIRVKVVNGRFFLEGSVDRRAQREEALKICQSYIQPKLISKKDGMAEPLAPAGLGDCNNLVWVRAGQAPDPDNIIVVRVDFVSLNKNYLKSFNFSWNPTIDAQGGIGFDTDAGKIFSGFQGTITSLFPKLAHMQSHGYGRILKSVTLLTKDYPNATEDKKPDEAVVTEELSIPVNKCQVDNQGRQVCAEEKGDPLSTSVKIRASSVKGSDKINLGVNASTTSFRTGSTSGSPPRVTDSVTTNIIVSSGESAALAGVVTESRTVGYSRAPSNQGTVNIFDISRNHNFLDDKSQFIIFVTPTKQTTPSPGTEELKRKFRLKR